MIFNFELFPKFPLMVNHYDGKIQLSKCAKILGIFYATNEVRWSNSSGDVDAKKS